MNKEVVPYFIFPSMTTAMEDLLYPSWLKCHRYYMEYYEEKLLSLC